MHRGAPLLALTSLAAASPAFSAVEEEDRGNFNVFAKGGVGGYTGELGANTQVGPAWGAIVNVQPFNIIGLEIGYEGSRHGIDEANAHLMRNGGSALVKVGLPFVESILPFVGAGIAAQWMAVQGTAPGFRADFMQEVPLAAGLEFNSGAFHTGLRATYSLMVDADFSNADTPATNPGGALMEGAFTLGGRF